MQSDARTVDQYLAELPEDRREAIATVRRLVAFYVDEHNRVLPHSAFGGQTPDEMYFGTGDAIPADLMGLDIGPATLRHFAEALRDSRTIIWNGPMGVFERPPFAAGTLGLARAVADAPGLSVVGGGDSVAAVQAAGVADRMGYLSTGGGAFLEYLEGRTLPGVAALDDA